MEILDRIIKELSDGYWHEVSEICEKVDLNGEKLKASLEFLKDYGFIDLSQGSAKITNAMSRFLYS